MVLSIPRQIENGLPSFCRACNKAANKMHEVVLSVNNLQCCKDRGEPIIKSISFEVRSGDIIVLSGKSGSGKTTLLKCLAHLNVYTGEVLLDGKKPLDYGIPAYRTRVLYVPQRPSLLPSNPHSFFETVMSFASRGGGKAKLQSECDPIGLSASWGIDEEMWSRDWSTLSGGESQRVALAIAVALPGTEVLLLDEPTSALDLETSEIIEKHIIKLIGAHSTLKAVVWITHSEEQAERVGTRRLMIENGGRLDEIRRPAR